MPLVKQRDREKWAVTWWRTTVMALHQTSRNSFDCLVSKFILLLKKKWNAKWKNASRQEQTSDWLFYLLWCSIKEPSVPQSFVSCRIFIHVITGVGRKTHLWSKYICLNELFASFPQTKKTQIQNKVYLFFFLFLFITGCTIFSTPQGAPDYKAHH